MRKVLCNVLYRLGLRRWAYKVSPSIYGYLYGKEARAALAAGLAAAGGMAKALKENAATAPAKHYGRLAKVHFMDELHSPVDRCVCCGEIVPEGRMVCPNCEDKEAGT